MGSIYPLRDARASANLRLPLESVVLLQNWSEEVRDRRVMAPGGPGVRRQKFLDNRTDFLGESSGSRLRLGCCPSRFGRQGNRARVFFGFAS